MKSKHNTTDRKIDFIKIDGINGNQTVRFDLESSRYLILHGRNGSGKTQALRIIDSILNVNILVLAYFLFKRAYISFEDGTRLIVIRSLSEDHKGDVIFKYFWGRNSFESTEEISVTSLENAVRQELGVRRIDNDSFYWSVDIEYHFGTFGRNQLVSSDVVQEALNLIEIAEVRSPSTRSVLSNVAKIRATLTGAQCQFIGTHRLVASRSIEPIDAQSPEFLPLSRNRGMKSENLYRFLPIQRLASRMQEYIEDALTQTTEIQAKFDSEFPEQIFRLPESTPTSYVDIVDSYESIEDKRKEIQEELGIDFISTQLPTTTTRALHPILRGVANIYFEGQRSQLKPLEDLLDKVLVFKRLINERLWRKTISISREFGLRVQAKDGPLDRNGKPAEIPLEKLSTGEQHEIYLFFNLAFADDNPALILIDEPEISLHVAWQRSFIDDIMEASQFTNPRFIVATHSPQIIGTRQAQMVTFDESPE